MAELLLLTRDDCELCEHFRQELADFAHGLELPVLRLQNVDSDPILQRRYGLQIPVLLLDGAVVCATRFDALELARLLRPRSAAAGESSGNR